MAISIPGLSLSILRQETTVRAGRPLLMSGRFTAFGLGMPALIRVYLEGPSYDPQVRHFDTFASPFTGDYSTNIIAEKDGRYIVYSQAFPPPLIPTGPPFPEAILLPPPLAESTRPPIAVGVPVEGGVDALLPTGERAFLPTPAQQPIEFRPIITVAPGITVTAPGVPTVPAIPYAPPPPPPAAPPPEVPVAPERVSASIDDIRFEPNVIVRDQTAVGLMSWRNTGESVRTFDIAFYLLGPTAVQYGPLQLEQNVRVAPQVTAATSLHLGTEGLPAGIYSVVAEVYDVETGQLIASRIFPARLELGAPEVPVPPPPAVPELPTPETVGQPTITMPRQLTVGEVWSGTVYLPTYGLARYYYNVQLVLQDPQGFDIPVTSGGYLIEPRETIQLPVSFSTAGLNPGDYSIFVRVLDQTGMMIAAFPIGFLSLIEAVVPPVPPPVPEAPALPTAGMFQVPIVNLPSQVTLGETWAGSIRIPTVWPAALPQPPTLPSYPVDIGVDLESPTGVRFDVADFRSSFIPGQTIDLPISYDTGPPMEANFHNIIRTITDLQGNRLFEDVIGRLSVLAPEVPMPPVPVPSEFPWIATNLGLSQVEVGDVLRVPVSYAHVGAAETVTLYAAIGNVVAGVFDEILHAQKTVSVPLDPDPRQRDDYIDIAITAIRPAIYDVYAKVDGIIPKAISPTQHNIVQVLEVIPPPPAISQITGLTVLLTPATYLPGDTINFAVWIDHQGAAEMVEIYAAIGIAGVWFDEVLAASQVIQLPQDDLLTGHVAFVPIEVPERPRLGTYAAYAKTIRRRPEVMSDIVTDVVEIRAAPEQYTLTVGQVPDIGTVEIDPEKPAYDRLDVVVLTASLPIKYRETWEFDYWDINGSRRDYNPVSVIMMRDSVATAHYRRL